MVYPMVVRGVGFFYITQGLLESWLFVGWKEGVVDLDKFLFAWKLMAAHLKISVWWSFVYNFEMGIYLMFRYFVNYIQLLCVLVFHSENIHLVVGFSYGLIGLVLDE